MNEGDPIRLRHMLDAAREAISFAKDKTRESLDTDRKLLLALVMDIAIIGEAASKVTREFQDKNPQIPWPEIIAMRNVLIHAYADIDEDIVWDTVTGNLPELVAELEKALPSEDKGA